MGAGLTPVAGQRPEVIALQVEGCERDPGGRCRLDSGVERGVGQQRDDSALQPTRRRSAEPRACLKHECRLVDAAGDRRKSRQELDRGGGQPARDPPGEDVHPAHTVPDRLVQTGSAGATPPWVGARPGAVSVSGRRGWGVRRRRGRGRGGRRSQRDAQRTAVGDQRLIIRTQLDLGQHHGRSRFDQPARARMTPPGRAGASSLSESSEVVNRVWAGRPVMIAHAIAASAGMHNGPIAIVPAGSARAIRVSGMRERGRGSGRERLSRIPVSRDSGGAASVRRALSQLLQPESLKQARIGVTAADRLAPWLAGLCSPGRSLARGSMWSGSRVVNVSRVRSLAERWVWTSVLNFASGVCWAPRRAGADGLGSAGAFPEWAASPGAPARRHSPFFLLPWPGRVPPWFGEAAGQAGEGRPVKPGRTARSSRGGPPGQAREGRPVKPGRRASQAPTAWLTAARSVRRL